MTADMASAASFHQDTENSPSNEQKEEQQPTNSTDAATSGNNVKTTKLENGNNPSVSSDTVTSISSEEQHASDKGEEDDDLLFSKADDAIVDILSFLFQALSLDEAEEDGMKQAASKIKGAPKVVSLSCAPEEEKHYWDALSSSASFALSTHIPDTSFRDTTKSVEASIKSIKGALNHSTAFETSRVVSESSMGDDDSPSSLIHLLSILGPVPPQEPKKECTDKTYAKFRQNFEQFGMSLDPSGKAWKFVESIQKLCLTSEFSGAFTPVSSDDMVPMAENMLATQHKFEEEGKPSYVDIGFHYTKRVNLKTIRSGGLLSKSERESKRVKPHRNNGTAFGDGIYSGHNAFDFEGYGDTGLIVARLPGLHMDVDQANEGYSKGNNSISGTHRLGMLLVLESSSQCVPLVQFDKQLSQTQSDLIESFQIRLGQVLDSTFNSMSGYRCSDSKGKRKAGVLLDTPPKGNSPHTSGGIQNFGTSLESLCKPVCGIDTFSLSLSSSFIRPVGRSCKHVFHRKIKAGHLEYSTSCFFCKAVNPYPAGQMPSGTMSVLRYDINHCQGYAESVGMIEILYEIPVATQLPFHNNPGQTHGPALRKAYLPATECGKKLLLRLQYAFQHGMTFSVGTSMTSGKENQVIWSLIPHKTSLKGGAFGFPDPNYILACNIMLDGLGVPSGDSLNSPGESDVLQTWNSEQPYDQLKVEECLCKIICSKYTAAPYDFKAYPFATSAVDGTNTKELQSILTSPNFENQLFEELRPMNMSNPCGFKSAEVPATTASASYANAPKPSDVEAHSFATTVVDGTSTITLHSITAVPEYENHSFEELRIEYMLNPYKNNPVPTKTAPISSLNTSKPGGHYTYPSVSSVVDQTSPVEQLQSITAVREYENHSFEELRIEYMLNNPHGYYKSNLLPLQTASTSYMNVSKSYDFKSYPFATYADGTSMMTLQSITALHEYENHSFEELRIEYMLNPYKHNPIPTKTAPTSYVHPGLGVG